MLRVGGVPGVREVGAHTVLSTVEPGSVPRNGPANAAGRGANPDEARPALPRYDRRVVAARATNPVS